MVEKISYNCSIGNHINYKNILILFSKSKFCFLVSFQVQFTVALVMAAITIHDDCDFPLWMHYMLIVYMATFLVLFGNFYTTAYLANEKRKSIQKAKNDPTVNNNNNVQKLDISSKVKKEI